MIDPHQNSLGRYPLLTNIEDVTKQGAWRQKKRISQTGYSKTVLEAMTLGSLLNLETTPWHNQATEDVTSGILLC